MKTNFYLTAWLLVCVLSNTATAQAPGDYKSNGTGGGRWNTATTWLTYDGTAYVAAPAAPSNGTPIWVQAGDTIAITSATTLSQLTADSSAALILAAGQTATLSGSININGFFSVNGTLTCATHVLSGAGTFSLNPGAVLNIGSTGGISAAGLSGNIQTEKRMFSPAATYNYSSTAAQVTGTGLPANITGTVIANNANSASGLSVSQTISIKSPGSFVVPASRVLTCKGTTAITGTGSFILNSGATFFIGHAAGISTTLSTGCIQVTGARMLPADANYTYNGTGAQVSGNALPSPIYGLLTISNPAGCTLSKNSTIAAPGRVVVSGALACSVYTLSGTGTFTLNSGATLLTAHPSGISASGTSGSIQTATINYNPTATYVYNGTAAQTTGTGLPTAVANLVVNNTGSGGVKLTADLTVNTNLTLSAGILCLDGHNLTVAAGKTITKQGGSLSLCGGTLFYNGPINLIYSGSTNLTTGAEVPTDPTLLNNLTIALSAGKTLTLSNDITVYGAVIMTSGALSPSVYSINYAPNALLIYNGTAAQTVSAEWPDSTCSTNISIRNTYAASGVSLNANKTSYSGMLTVQKGGFFNSSTFLLDGSGHISIAAGATFITRNAAGVSPEGAIRLTGNRLFAPGSSYTFNATVVQETGREMPAMVSNLIINNTAATNPVVLLTRLETDTLIITGTLVLASGVLDAGNQQMNLLFHSSNTPISRAAGSLQLGAASSLQFGMPGFTAGAPFTLPDNLFTGAPLFRNLVLSRTNGLILGNQNLTLNGTLILTTGVLNLANTTLTFQDSDKPVEVGSGSVTVGPGASLQFGTAGHTGGAAFTLVDQFFSTPPKFANLTINRTNSLALETQAITLTGTLNLVNGSFLVQAGTLKLEGTVTVTNGTLTGGPLSTLIVGGTGSTIILPFIQNGLHTLAVSRSNTGTMPAVKLGADLHIHNSLNLESGSLALGTNNLTLNPVADILNADANHYIITNNSAAAGGYLIRSVAAESVLFPVGTTTYTPALVSNSIDMPQAFRARVFNGVLAAGTSGSAFPYSSMVVGKTWLVEKVVADSADALITLQWNAGDEATAYDREHSYVSNFKNGIWDTATASVATEWNAGVFRQTWSGRSGFPAFSVQKERIIRLVNWIAFGAARSGPEVVLKWTVGNAKGDRRFDIERSVDKIIFRSIGRVTAAGTTASTVTYTFADQAPVLYQNSWYRVKQTGSDSTFNYSEIVRVMVDPVSGSMVYPVPVQDKATVVLFASYGGWADVCLADASGKLVKKQAVHLTRGNNSITVPMRDLPRGMYLLQVIADGTVYMVHKIVK